MIAPGFWSGRRVLITGHSGFIGSWLALTLHRLGALVTGAALPAPTEPSHFGAARLAAVLDHRLVDLREPGPIRQLLAEVRPQVVFHLAAQALVRHAHAEPVETFASNVMGTVNLLEAVRACPSVEGVLVYTTDKVYQNREWCWGYRECDPLGGDEPYGASKVAVEQVVRAYRQGYFSASARAVPVAVVRAGNVIGGGDWAADRLVPDAMRAFAAGRALTVRHPSAVRPWQHVLEPVGFTLLLGRQLLEQPDLAGQAWNVGPESAAMRPVAWLADQLVAHWAGALPWRTVGEAGPHESHTLTLDSTQARALLGWHPRWGLERAVAATVAWYRAFYQGGEAMALSSGQIEEFLDGE